MLRAFRVFIVVFGVLLTRTASADTSTLLLIDPDPELEAAVRTALGAWRTPILVERVAGPGSTMPRSAERARTLANQRRAGAVVWISKSDDGYALWMYDRKDDRVVARRLANSPPFDDATAASVALAIKTLLRHSNVPPPREKLTEPAPDPWLRLLLMAGIRPIATSSIQAEPRLGVGLGAWPWQPGERVELGAGIELTSGPGIGVQDSLFAGHWSETTVLFGLYGRLTLAGGFDVTFAPSFGFDIALLDGAVREPPQAASEVRLNPAASAHLELGYDLGTALRPALRVGVVRPLRTQSYQVRGEPVLEVAPLMLSALLGLEVGLL